MASIIDGLFFIGLGAFLLWAATKLFEDDHGA
jgi:hypothetical protein